MRLASATLAADSTPPPMRHLTTGCRHGGLQAEVNLGCRSRAPWATEDSVHARRCGSGRWGNSSGRDSVSGRQWLRWLLNTSRFRCAPAFSVAVWPVGPWRRPCQGVVGTAPEACYRSAAGASASSFASSSKQSPALVPTWCGWCRVDRASGRTPSSRHSIPLRNGRGWSCR
jgi:hypothetical protein